MMKRNKIYISTLVFVILAYGCDDLWGGHFISFIVKNKTNKNIESCKFYGGHYDLGYGDSIVYTKTIAPNDSAIFVWKNPELVGDGAFCIKVNNIERSFGYFSNGTILTDIYTLKVYNDSIR